MVPCAICSESTVLRYRGHVGYQQPTRFDIMYCSGCDTASAFPLAVNDKLYDLIYSKGELIPGYDRYHRYAQQVLKVKDPLAYLTEAEDVYWGVSQFLSTPKEAGKVLEVGSGLGYLTYALSKKGYDIQGIDISFPAIMQAQKRYGNLFQCTNIHHYSQHMGGRFQTVILTEVLEHIADPEKFLASIVHIIAPGGSIILTTPNKSAYDPDVIWETEPPPIHLWWFSEKSIETLGKKFGLNVEFTDFTPYTQSHRQHLVQTPHEPTRHARLNAAGEVALKDWKESFKIFLKKSLKTLGLWEKVKQLQNRPRLTSPLTSRRATLCARLKK